MMPVPSGRSGTTAEAGVAITFFDRRALVPLPTLPPNLLRSLRVHAHIGAMGHKAMWTKGTP